MLAADRLRCTPWELMQQGTFWREAAMVARAAENGAAAEKQKAAERRARSRQKMGSR